MFVSRCVALAFGFLIGLLPLSAQQVPRQMSLQGVLRLEGDKPVPDGMHLVTFSLYSSPESPTPFWSETQQVESLGGLFTVLLGSAVALPSEFPASSWVGMRMGSGAEFSRIALTSVPYSLTASSLSSDATGAVLSLNGSQGRLSLRGEDGLEVRRDSRGGLILGYSSEKKGEGTLNQGTEWLLAGNTNANANSWLGTSNNVPLIVKTNNTERFRVLASGLGNVGIGETYPGSRLTVARTFHLTNTGGAPELKLSAPSGSYSTIFTTSYQSSNITYTLPPNNGNPGDVLQSNGSGALTWADNGWLSEGNSNITSSRFLGTTNAQPLIVKTNNTERFRVTPSGAMGINEDAPTQKLEVAGNIMIKTDGNNTGEMRFQEPSNFFGKNYVGLKAGSVPTNIVFTLPSSLPTESGQVLTAGPTGIMSWTTVEGGGSGGGLLYFAESRHTSSPNNSVPVHRFAAIGAESNIDVALSPVGDGALMAQVPDGTSAGGAKRGAKAVDWQMDRESDDQVASGNFSVISGGESNSVGGNFSAVGGGAGNTVDGNFSSVGGGAGNSVDGDYSAVVGGESNSVAFDATYSTVVGGLNNRVGGNESGSEASSIVGGRSNQLFGNYSSILGGRGLELSGQGSFAFHANNYSFDDDDYVRDMVVSANRTGILGNVDLWIVNNDNTPRSLRFYEAYDQEGNFPNGTNYAAFRAADDMASDVTWTLPDADGLDGQPLITDGAATLSWGAVSTVGIADNAVNGAKIAMGADSEGDIMYYDGTDYVRLPIGNADQVLTVVGGVPVWADAIGQSARPEETIEHKTNDANRRINLLANALSPVVSEPSAGRVLGNIALNTEIAYDNISALGGKYAANVKVDGTDVNSAVQVSPKGDLPDGMAIAYAYIVEPGTARIVFVNVSGKDIPKSKILVNIAVVQK